jgi:hypothetical protein
MRVRAVYRRSGRPSLRTPDRCGGTITLTDQFRRNADRVQRPEGVRRYGASCARREAGGEDGMSASGRAWLDVAMRETTRRVALRLAGGAALVACAGAGSGRVALAQEASPVASPAGGNSLIGKYVVIRIRTVKPDRSADELMTLIGEGFVPLLQEVPGFIWYVAGANPETRGQFSVGVFEDEAGAAESSRRAAAWGAQGAADFVEGEPAVYEGVIGVTAESSGAAVPGSPQALAPGDELAGKYVVIRLRQPNPDWPVEEVMELIGEGYVPLVREIPGFVAYFGSADPVSGGQAYVGVFDDKAGADESTRVAREWLTENSYTFFAGDPIVAEGVIGAAAEPAE